MIQSTSRMDLYLGMWSMARASNILNNCTALRNGTGKPAAPSKDDGCQWWAPVILFGGTIDLADDWPNSSYSTAYTPKQQ